MSQTVIPWGDPKAVKKWSAGLAVEIPTKSYFERRFIGTDQNSCIQRKTELESDSGDTIQFDLSVQLRGDVTYGDNRLKGKEEQLKFYTDKVSIDQVRKAVSAGGAMTRKRTIHNLRQIAKDRASDYWSQWFDEVLFVYLSGARGINLDYVLPADFNGFAQNPLQAPDSVHLMFGGSATSKATLTANDKMTRMLIERAAVKAEMLRAKDPKTANMMPLMVEGEAHYLTIMSPFQAYDLRTEQGERGWLEIQKAAAAAEGRNNPIFKGGLGMVNNVVLHSHQRAVRFSDYGAGGDVAAGRALFMGRQAGVIAYGTANTGLRFSWKEETDDYGNEPTVASGTIIGVKKSRFNERDFGVISLDTACADPNP